MSPQITEPSKTTSMGGSSPANAKSWALGVVGAVIGGTVGWFVFSMLYGEGYYALALPGALVGFGFAKLSGIRSVAAGVFCAIVAAGLMFMCEWNFRFFTDDPSFGYFVRNVHELSSATFLMFFLGVAMAFWFGKGS